MLVLQNMAAVDGTTASIAYQPYSGAGTITGNKASIDFVGNASSNFKTQIAFEVSNGSTPSEAMRIANNGNVGIGTTAPQTTLDVRGNARVLTGGNSQGLLGQDASNNNLFSLTRQTNDLSITSYAGIGLAANQTGGPSTSYNLYINSSGNVGIGTAGPIAPLHISSTTFEPGLPSYAFNQIEMGAISMANGWAVNGLAMSNYNTGSGFGLIGVQGDSIYFGHSSGTSGTSLVQMASNGNMTVYGASTTCTIGGGTGATNCTSDERLKQDIKPIPDALAKLSQIKGVTFHWRDPKKDADEHIGVIAQDVEKVFPQAVGEVDDKTLGKAKTVDIAALVAPMIEAMKELKTDNDNLKAANYYEAAQIKALTARLDAIEATQTSKGR